MSQVMTFIKTHTLALVCGVIALLGLVAYFIYPIPGIFADLQAEAIKSQATYTSLTALRDEQRTLPVVDLSGTAKPLPYPFPTKPVIKEGQEALKRLGEQAKNALDQVVQLNQRPLLVPGSLPRPTSLARQQFFDAYKAVTVQSGDGAERGIVRTVLHGAVPPTEQELTERREARRNEIYTTVQQTDAAHQVVNKEEVDAAIAKMERELPMQQRISRAKTSKIYVSPLAVETHQGLKGPDLPDASTIFNAQYSLWLQMIAFEALDDANKAATNVLDAPVKHLLLLKVPMEAAQVVATSNGATGFGADPNAAAAAPAPELVPDASATLAQDFSLNGGPLGYSHNSLYDPVQIQMVLRVDVRQLPQVLATLGRERLLKIRNVNFHTVDMGKAAQEGYIYDQTGTTPLVEVTLDCDVLMLRQWVVPFMPDPVKAYFATRSNPAAAAP